MDKTTEIANVGDKISISLSGYSPFFKSSDKPLLLVNTLHEVIGVDSVRSYFQFEGELKYIEHGRYQIIKQIPEEEHAKIGDLVSVKTPEGFVGFSGQEIRHARVAICTENRIGVFYEGNVWYYLHGDYEILERVSDHVAQEHSNGTLLDDDEDKTLNRGERVIGVGCQKKKGAFE